MSEIHRPTASTRSSYTPGPTLENIVRLARYEKDIFAIRDRVEALLHQPGVNLEDVVTSTGCAAEIVLAAYEGRPSVDLSDHSAILRHFNLTLDGVVQSAEPLTN